MATALPPIIRWMQIAVFAATTAYFLLFVSIYHKGPEFVVVPAPRRLKPRIYTETAYRQKKTIENTSFPMTTELPKTTEIKIKTPCYRQIQLWVDSALPQTPRIIECPGFDCGVKYVEDRSFETMVKSDVVIHDFHRSGKNWHWDEMQRRRLPNQVWAFYTLEPRTLPTRKYEHLYNYTVTYRRESTFLAPYGIYDPTKQTISPDDKPNWASGRPKMIAWMASNCGGYTWKRFDFVKELSKHIPVDIYGGCGRLHCSRDNSGCWNLLRTYKFYLALENSECRDYITEKYWGNSLQHGLLPIVYGPPKEDYERVAPPNSFIHLQDFTSMETLVQYLRLVSSNETLYNSYFEWKHIGSSRRYYLHDEVKCRMASRFHRDEEDGPGGGFSKEGANVTLYDFWQTRCSLNVTGFPHDF